ncbi:hypothetical protein RRG08_014852 [Elysia crispata]|uniref:Uncharacterized protein n=1 Tax=Elysia crispata TaxID=231223 RepID=A0AAE1DA34_9GAST|nr:hypothetical protein RRG08_014852 [Elysia crispata]
MQPSSKPLAASVPGSRTQGNNLAMHRLDISDRDQLFSTFTFRPDEDFQKLNVNIPERIPDWLWAVLTAMLGISTETRKGSYVIANALRISTVTSALVFAGCGVVFNVFDVMSELTRTTLLIAICKSLLGAYWVGMGIYARSLAARLFSNTLFVQCIRMHTKTIFKINTAVIILVLSLTASSLNIYLTRRLMDQNDEPKDPKTSEITDGNCKTAGVHVAVCEVYFMARVVFCVFNLLWNLLVTSILLSVCHTHTICIRRFIKELLYDNKVYEEYLMLQALGPKAPLVEDNNKQSARSKRMTTLIESNIWDNDINELDDDDHKNDGAAPDAARILKTMRNIRRSRSSTLDSGPVHTGYDQLDGDGTRSPYCNTTSALEQTTNFQGHVEEEITPAGQYSSALRADEELYRQALQEGKPPILSNEDLLFTHFQLVRRLCSTSRLLQRWMMSIISFVLLWSALFVIYLTNTSINWLSLFEFIVPLVILFLLTSTYAEVNFEGSRIVRFVLPTIDRMPVLAHMKSDHPELKIFSFSLSYNAIMTVVAGIAVSFATSIILEQVTN